MGPSKSVTSVYRASQRTPLEIMNGKIEIAKPQNRAVQSASGVARTIATPQTRAVQSASKAEPQPLSHVAQVDFDFDVSIEQLHSIILGKDDENLKFLRSLLKCKVHYMKRGSCGLPEFVVKAENKVALDEAAWNIEDLFDYVQKEVQKCGVRTPSHAYGCPNVALPCLKIDKVVKAGLEGQEDTPATSA